MNPNNNANNGRNNSNKNDLDSILNESTNSIFEGTRSVAKSGYNSSANNTVNKAKSEINAQADSMLREIEERRMRRAARQKELEQQVQAESEAKARRKARMQAQEEAEGRLRNGSVGSVSTTNQTPSISSSKSKFSNTPHVTNDVLENFNSMPSHRSRNSNENGNESSAKPQNRNNLNEQQGSTQRRRRTVSSGETQVMPKIADSKTYSKKPKSNTEPSASSQRRTPSSSNTRRKPSGKSSTGKPVRESSEAPLKRRTPGTSNSVSAHSTSARRPVKPQAAVSSNTRRQKKPKEVNNMKELRDWIIAIAVAVVISLLIRNFVFTLVKVQGESMQPTLQNEDRLYVNRFFYSPKKGDVVIFRPASDPERPYVKRVIATEGDTVYIDFETGDVYVNGNIIDEPYIKAKTTRSGEYIAGLIANGQYSKDNPIVIEKGKIFVMGDNRNNSKDSRMIGQVPKSELIGGAVFRFWPLSNFGSVSYKATTSYLIEDDKMNFSFVA